MKLFRFFQKYLPYFICLVFIIAFSTLSIIRHNHYESYGFDLGINDQVVWEYSKFREPVTTIDHAAFESKLDIHIELVYALISPFYWIWSDPRMLLLLEVVFVCTSGLAIYLLAKKYKLHEWLQIVLLISYLMFYGVQNALWFDVHSATFATAFLAWFIYFLISGKKKLTILFFVLAITAKENIAGLTFLISVVYFITTRKKIAIAYALSSIAYLGFVFGVYFPFLVEGGYKFANSNGLLTKLDPALMFNSIEKRHVYLYTLLSNGFLPLLNPLYLIPPLGDLASYFLLAQNKVSGAQGLFLHYRVTLAPLMSFATIATIAKYKKLNSKKIALYLLFCILLAQYLLHLPLSYLSKSWFWTETPAVKNINTVLEHLPKDASVVAQDNILPHVSQREKIYMLWPNQKDFEENSPCGEPTCDWFRWFKNPEYMVVDTSNHWDIRHLVTERDPYIRGIKNLEKEKVISVYKRSGTATLYKVNRNPEE